MVNFRKDEVLINEGVKLTAETGRCLMWPRNNNLEIDASLVFWQMEDLLHPVDY